MSSGFYRVDAGELLGPALTLDGPSGHYEASSHGSYSYPIEGFWNYYPDFTSACLGEKINPGMSFADKVILLDAGVFDGLSTSAKLKVLRIIGELPE